VRNNGGAALLYHDVLEDTTEALPGWLEEEVAVLVRDMTFEGGFAQEQNDIWEKPPIIRLLKLYDKVNNLLDGSWMSEEKRERYIEFTRALAHDVAENYGKLSIVKLASTF
jgi:(p)ppGpp synthase/HD superfamily hydrolase